MSGLRFAEEDKKADAETHLAVARSQNTGTGILGKLQKMKGSLLAVFFNLYENGLICSAADCRHKGVVFIENVWTG